MSVRLSSPARVVADHGHQFMIARHPTSTSVIVTVLKETHRGRSPGGLSLIRSLIHLRTPASIRGYQTSLSRPANLRGRSCTVIRNPEKPYVPGGGVARARKSGPVQRGAGLRSLPPEGAAGGFRCWQARGRLGRAARFEAGFFPGIGVR